MDAASVHSQNSHPSYCSPPIPSSQVGDNYSPGLKRTNDAAFGNDVNDPATSSYSQQTGESPLTIWPSAFTIPSKIIKNTRKNRRTWSGLNIPPQLIEEDVYKLSWTQLEKADVSGLPSLDYAIYLFHTFKFHLGQTYRLFDEVEFVNQIRDFYSDAQSKAEENRLWYVKFLLILAFGTAFLSSQPLPSKEPPGAKFFVRAMGLMPDHTALWKDSLFAIEVLAMVGLYLYSIDERESAHLGQAIRIAQLEGLHTQLPDNELGSETVTSCRDLWWTLYIMDRHFSSSLGLPMSVQDNDISTPVNPPNVGSQDDSARSLQVNLSHLLSVILTILKERLDILGQPGNENSEAFLGQTAAVISTEIFLPYDLEFTFGAALHLNMATALFPGVADDQGCRLLIHQLLDNMIARGNRLASVRKQELVYLETQCQELVAQVQQQGLQTLSLAVTDEDLARKADEEQQRLLTQETLGMEVPMNCVQNPMTSDMEFLDNIGISSEEFLSIVHQIGDPDIMPENMLTLE
ncbi:hypothetical protein BFJ68_g13835 [Fusarium oxysporum]|uniref:Xylanolytic transcriptional activator regulatory domain-containing protein n=1 Tax=Fusarium oxysporum TaxID=5507 RepID=A0A420PZC0_FUSOX|nr:hypothetical protein BFJ68_g13835 [Fusarium oxysporum]